MTTLQKKCKPNAAEAVTTAFIRWRSKSHCPIGLVRLRRLAMLDLIQWPAMLVTVIAAWMVGSQRKFKRNWGFWLFLLSNVLWIAWGWHDNAYALILLQLCLAFLNIRGALKNRTSESNPAS